MADYNDTGWVAVFKGTPDEIDVHSWNNNGNALIVDRGTGRLVVAADQEGFVRLEETGRIVAAIPAAPGWNLKISESYNAGATTFVAPIAAWLVAADGRVIPVPASHDESLEPLRRQPGEVHAPGEPTD